MKPTTNVSVITSTGVQEESFFGIESENVAHILGILRNKLYSDKMLAIIREYSTNAYDAHIEAGIPDRPISITLPGYLNPSFKIRDYGYGLSHHDIMKVYSSYGASTKRESNEQVGMMGLGCKSAFCYSNIFSIISYYNGMKTMYNAFIDETNVGKVTSVLSVPSDEPSGIEIVIGIKPEDVAGFVEKALDFYRFFNPRPEIFGGDYKIPENQFSMCGDGWDMIIPTKRYTYSYNNSYIVMGNVAYPIDRSHLNYYGTVLGLGCVIYANIGDVSIAASREALEYDEKTINYIKNRVTEINDEICSLLELYIENSSSYINACQTLAYFKDSFPTLTMPSLYYDGNQLHDMLYQKTLSETRCDFQNIRFDKHNKLSNLVKEEFIHLNKRGFIFNDLDKTTWVRPSIINFFNSDDVNIDYTYTLIKGDINCLLQHKFFNGMENDLIYLSNYASAPVRKKAVITNLDRRNCKVFLFDAENQIWNQTDNNLITGSGVYVYIRNFVPVMGDNNGLANLIKQLKNMNIDFPVYGIRDSVKTLGNGWVEMDDCLRRILPKLGENMNFSGYERRQGAYLIHSFWHFDIGDINTMPDCEITDFIKEVYTIKNDVNDAAYSACYTYCNLANKYGMPSPINSIENNEIYKKAKELLNKYPCLDIILKDINYSWQTKRERLPEFCEYLKMIRKVPAE